MVSSPQHEPTMEEILASIRKIISEDSSEQSAEAPKAAEPEADILELTQEVAPEPVAAVAPAPEPVHEEPVAPPAPEPEQDVVFEPIEEPAPMAAAAPAGNDIFSDKTRQSIDDAFAALDEPEEEYAAPAPRRASAADISGLSVEAVFERAVRDAFEPVVKQWLNENAPQVMDRMKPLIREWMDEHFPALLEGAVRDEVARVARARGTKR